VTRAAPVAGPEVDRAVYAAALAALEMVPDGASIGLGSGRAASAFISALGAKVRDGLRVKGVATSSASANLAAQNGIALSPLGAAGSLDLVVDGADEVAPNLDLVKGWGGALVRERIVTAAARHQVIIVDDSKLVNAIGERGRIPVEVIPLAQSLVDGELRRLGLLPSLRVEGAAPFVSENGNNILDCALARPVQDPHEIREMEQSILAIAGVVDTGLFLGTATVVLVGYPAGHVDTRRRKS
jgi:ribose 5-phosphate isomerase A